MDEKRLMEKYDKLNRRMQRYFSSFFTGTSLTSVHALVLQYLIVESKKRDIFPKGVLKESACHFPLSCVYCTSTNKRGNGGILRVSAAYKRR